MMEWWEDATVCLWCELPLVDWKGGGIKWAEIGYGLCRPCLDSAHEMAFPGRYTEITVTRAGEGKQKAISKALRWHIWERDDFRCQVCGSRHYLEVDHIFPESRGGETVPDNLQTLCQRCNRKKGAKIGPETND